jgi:hypothetical protein
VPELNNGFYKYDVFHHRATEITEKGLNPGESVVTAKDLVSSR